jgi:hypothetical protein
MKKKKSQDMINRILKFLAGVFGHSNYGRMFENRELEKEGGQMQSSRAVVPKKSPLWVFGNGNREGTQNMMYMVYLQDDTGYVLH